MLRDHDDGLTTVPGGYTVGEAVRDWLTFGQGKRDTTQITCGGVASQRRQVRRRGRARPIVGTVGVVVRTGDAANIV